MNLDHIATPITDSNLVDMSGVGLKIHTKYVREDVARLLERHLLAEKEEHVQTMADYMTLARPLDGHDVTECLMNLNELKRRLAVCRELLSESALWTEDNPSQSARKEHLVDRIAEFLKATTPLARLK